MSNNGGYNLGGINATGQVMEGTYALVDKDTPLSVRTKLSPVDGREMQLVFSDEFEREGRTFHPVSLQLSIGYSLQDAHSLLG